MFNILGITFYWYGLLIGVGIITAIDIAFRSNNKNKEKGFKWAILWSIVGGVVGARAYHVINFWDAYYKVHFIKVFYLWEGGLGIWGAIAGGILGLSVYCHIKKLKFIKILDVLVIGVPLAQTIGRIGNYINGEIIGKNGEPLFAYEGMLNLLLFVILFGISRKKRRIGLTSGIYLIGYGLIRTCLENLRPTGSVWAVFNIPTAIIFGALSVLSGLFLIFFRKKRS